MAFGNSRFREANELHPSATQPRALQPEQVSDAILERNLDVPRGVDSVQRTARIPSATHNVNRFLDSASEHEQGIGFGYSHH